MEIFLSLSRVLVIIKGTKSSFSVRKMIAFSTSMLVFHATNTNFSSQGSFSMPKNIVFYMPCLFFVVINSDLSSQGSFSIKNERELF